MIGHVNNMCCWSVSSLLQKKQLTWSIMPKQYNLSLVANLPLQVIHKVNKARGLAGLANRILRQ